MIVMMIAITPSLNASSRCRGHDLCRGCELRNGKDAVCQGFNSRLAETAIQILSPTMSSVTEYAEMTGPFLGLTYIEVDVSEARAVRLTSQRGRDYQQVCHRKISSAHGEQRWAPLRQHIHL